MGLRHPVTWMNHGTRISAPSYCRWVLLLYVGARIFFDITYSYGIIFIRVCVLCMSRMNESCHISMNHVTYDSFMSHIMSAFVVSYIYESCHIFISHVHV